MAQADGSIRIDTKIDTKQAQQDYSNFEKFVNDTAKKIQSDINKGSNRVNSLTEKFEDTNKALAKTNAQMDELALKISKSYTPEGLSTAQIDDFINKQLQADKEYQALNTRAEELYVKSERYSKELANAKLKLQSLNEQYANVKSVQDDIKAKQKDATQETKKTKNEVKKATDKSSQFNRTMKKTAQSANAISKATKSINSGITSGIKKLAKYALVLMGVRGITGLIRNSISEWYEGGSEQAKQLQADIESIKASIGSGLAPVLQAVLNIFYKILGVVGAIIKAFTGVNLLGKSIAKSSKSTEKSSGGTAKNADKQLASFDKINKMQDTSSGGGAGGSTVDPTDLNAIMMQYEGLANKIKSTFEFLLEPFVKAWNNEGKNVTDSMMNAFLSIKSLFGEIGKSFELIWTNGTVQKAIETILRIIASIYDSVSNIAKAWENAWKNNRVGNKIIQNLSNALQNVLDIIYLIQKKWEEWTASESYQVMANAVIKVIEIISNIIEKITGKWKEFMDGIGGDILETAFQIISKIVELIGVILSMLEPIGDYLMSEFEPVLTAVGNSIKGLLTIIEGLLDFLIGVFTGDWERAWKGIETIFTTIWEGIKTTFQNIWQGILDYFSESKNQLSTYWTNLWEGVKNLFSNIWNSIVEFATNTFNSLLNKIDSIFLGMKDIILTIFQSVKNKLSEIWNNISSTVSNIINGIKNTISNVLNAIKGVWNNIWNSLSSTVSNVWNGIWGTIKNVINSILSGIEKMVNGIISGINKMSSAFRRLSFSIPDWVPSVGGKSFSINIPQISSVSLPRLARGGIAYQPTQAIIGEAGKEAIIPLENNTEWLDKLADRIASKISSNNGTTTFVAELDGDVLFKKVYSKNEDYNFATNGGGL